MSPRLASLALAGLLAACQHAPAPAPAPAPPAPSPPGQELPLPSPVAEAGPPCLAQIRPGTADPELRDLQFRVFDDPIRGTVVGILACIVSDRVPAMGYLSVVATVIDARWPERASAITLIGDEVFALNPVVPRRAGQPRLIAMLGREVTLPPGTGVAPGALLRLRVQPCDGADAGRCGTAPIQVIDLAPRRVTVRRY